MTTPGVIPFLLAAKKATYAGKGLESTSSRPESHDLEYTEGNLKYIDTYLGSAEFAGEEALWENGQPFWAMNYVGRVISDGFDGDFLKEALRHVPEDLPYRGPESYKSGSYTYTCSVQGEFDWFTGQEEIFHEETKVYECRFHGGAIK
ncbi:DUF5680 domain-containing protein [Gorillibacterium massiliense]|uniref:DUF5680 domain-containing protein n=1 Tax=Gorillibacterium massiliense TaxID=1280390 RepID=UPI0004B4C345|nr:DUF5680 domain-containing protein [Gorillibacterium massiliense]